MNIQSVTIDTTGIVSNLCEIAMQFNSDKCPYSKETTSGHRHPYTPVYDTLFSSLRTQSINIAEIGIEKNDSINIWRNIFPTQTFMDLSIMSNIYKKQSIKIYQMFIMKRLM